MNDRAAPAAAAANSDLLSGLLQTDPYWSGVDQGANAGLIAGLRRYASVAALCGLAVGVLVLVGWGLDIRLLKSVLPAYPTMKANTALALVFAGAALWLAHPARALRRAGSLSAILSLVPVLIGLGTLAEYAGWDLSIDELLVRDDATAVATAAPGRPSPITAAAFVLLGSALLALRFERPARHRVSQYLALATVVLSFFGLLGYLYDAHLLRDHPAYTTIALHTAIVLLLLGTGLIALHADSGPFQPLARGSAGGLLARRIMPATLLFSTTLGWLRMEAQQAGLVDTAMGLVVMVFFVSGFVIVITMLSARIIDRLDAQRFRAAGAARIWEHVFQHAGWGIALRSTDGRTLLTVNDAFARMHGYAREELIGRSAIDLYAAPAVDKALDAVRQAIEQGHYLTESTRLRKDGSQFAALIDLAALRGEQGQLLALAANVQDVTLLKLAEQQAREAQRQVEQIAHRLRLALRAGAIGTWDWDIDSNVVTWDEQMYALYGVAPGAPIWYSTWVDAVLPEDRPAAEATLQRTLAEKRGSDNHFRIRHPTLGIRSIDASEEPVLDAQGRVIRLVGVNKDVTEHRRLEASLRASEERLRLSFEHSAVGSAIVSLAGGWLNVNQAFCDMVGYTHAELLERDFQSITHPEDLAADLELSRQLEAGQIPHYTMEKRHIHKAGHAVWVRLSCGLARDTQGRPVHFVLAVEDITERKRAEASAASATRELEAFSYSVAHDLRAPLRAINGFGKILLGNEALQQDEDARACLGHIREASNRMGQLIDDLLSLSRVGRAELHLAEVDLSSLAREVCTRLQGSAPERRVEFVIEDRLHAQADGRLLLIALENLLGNAWKYSGKHATARIEFGARHEGAQTVFYIRDDGDGFDMAHAGKLFAPFQRLHSPQDFEGSGIGLATVQRIIHRHGGTIRAEAAVGKGATFFFTLG